MRLPPDLEKRCLELAGEGAKIPAKQGNSSPRRASKERAERVLVTPAGPDHDATLGQRAHAMASGNTTPPSDVSQVAADASRHLDAVATDAVVVRCTLPGEPMVKYRPRYSLKTGRFYTPRTTKEHQQALAAAAVAAASLTPDAGWAYGIRAVFHVRSYHRKDVDNMLKAVLDAMNRLAFRDDAQVEELMGWKVCDPLNPRTEFVVYRLHQIQRDEGACVQCGKAFRMFRSWQKRQYCSRKCFGLSERSAVVVHCAHCNKELLRAPAQVEKNKGGEFFCSGACIGLHKRINVNCTVCGAALSRPQSFSKSGQTNFFCGRVCQAAFRVGKTSSAPKEARSEWTRRAWETRRARKQAPADGSAPAGTPAPGNG